MACWLLWDYRSRIDFCLPLGNEAPA